MAKISKKARQELLVAVSDRYRIAEKGDKSRILSEIVALTGYHPKHAIRILNRLPTSARVRGAGKSRVYNEGAGRLWSSFGRHRIGCAESGSKRFFLFWWILSNATVTFILT